MADNVSITPGSGVSVAADDVSSVYYQRVKLALGADGVASDAPVGGGVESGVLRVTVASDSTGVLSVDDNGGTLTVDSPQLPAALAANGGLKVEGVAGGVAVPVSAASLPLPTGAATAAKQPAIGTAGTASTDVITVQGIASMTALKVDGSAVTQPVSGTVTVQDGGGSITVDGTVAVSGTVTADTELPAAAALADGAANPSTPTVGAATLVWNGTTWDRLKGDTTNGAYVNVKAMIALPAGTNNIGDVDVLTVPADPFGANADAASATGSISAKLRFIAATGIPITGTVTVGSHAVTNAGTFAVQAACAGDVAHDGADSGNPIKTGGRAMTTARTAVADGDRADHAVDVQGRTIVERDGPRELDVMQSTTITSSTSETTVGTAVASTFLDVIDCIVCNSSATATLVTFKDSTAGTTRFVLYVPAGATVGFSGQRWPQATVNNNWTATCGTSVASVYVSLRMRKTK